MYIQRLGGDKSVDERYGCLLPIDQVLKEPEYVGEYKPFE
jgi:hypothetical protein